MSYLIALDDGHGTNTSGKRSPNFDDDSYMLENDFNWVTTRYIAEGLTRCGIEYIYTAPEREDVDLSTRVQRANNANADLFISVHANAYTGEWSNTQGVEVYHYPGYAEDITNNIYNRLLEGTEQVARGIKTSKELYVLKYTQMNAVLVEAGFMDNLEEAELLLSDDFRRETAEEIVHGICDTFGVEYIVRG